MASTGSLVNNETDDSDSSSSLFKTQCDPISPNRRPRNVSTSVVIQSPAKTQLRHDSSESSSELEPFNLRVIFENWKKKKRRKRKYKPTGRPRGRPKGSFKTTQSLITRSKKDLFRDKGFQFPLVESENGRKPLLWKKILGYEQAVARGFFNYVKEKKCESHLGEALKQLDVGEDLEKEGFAVRKYKYLDDEGSISPIEEPNVEDSELNDPVECDIKLVENSCFIISTEFPKKVKTKMKNKVLKSKNDIREDNKDDEIDLPTKKKNSMDKQKRNGIYIEGLHD
ncbi:TATA box-binding protein-associated factor RNA polymerase I subunit D isoform X1 [Antechinus flavipes]|uniref:TATA box-binding protein-associated factor RNA polymerase I subunit D isoform X1 n=1 Tax=Antechinus flavipes TaxID=38775 RepID=UPI0022367F5C|nr:TATA box-binding protein-associated factor RNA polymerase I subunit D isoform X1 [Antechinus flavipes]